MKNNFNDILNTLKHNDTSSSDSDEQLLLSNMLAGTFRKNAPEDDFTFRNRKDSASNDEQAILAKNDFNQNLSFKASSGNLREKEENDFIENKQKIDSFNNEEDKHKTKVVGREEEGYDIADIDSRYNKQSQDSRFSSTEEKQDKGKKKSEKRRNELYKEFDSNDSIEGGLSNALESSNPFNPDFNSSSSIQLDKYSPSPESSFETFQSDSLPNDSFSTTVENGALKKLFSFYSSIGKRQSFEKMRCKQFTNFFADLEIDENLIDKKKVELAFIGVDKKRRGIGFDQFVELLVFVAEKVYEGEEAEVSFRRFLEEKLSPLFWKIYKETIMGQEDKLLNSEISHACLLLVKKKKQLLKKIYTTYFVEETVDMNKGNLEKLAKSSKKRFLKFLTDFELRPNYLNNSATSNFFNYIMNGEEHGKVEIMLDTLKQNLDSKHGILFTLEKFVFFIVKISLYIFSEAENLPKALRSFNPKDEEKLYMLLEVLENSKGFLRFKKGRKGICHLTLKAGFIYKLNIEYSYFPNFKDITNEFEENERFFFVNRRKTSASKKKSNLLKTVLQKNTVGSIKTTTRKKKTGMDFLSGDQFLNLIEPYIKEIKSLYNQFSRGSISFDGFVDLLIRLKLLQKKMHGKRKNAINITLAENVFRNVAEEKRSKRVDNIFENNDDDFSIDFQQFLTALGLIVERVYQQDELVKATKKFIENHLLNVLNDNEQETVESEKLHSILNSKEKNKKNKNEAIEESLDTLRNMSQLNGFREIVLNLKKTVKPIFKFSLAKTNFLKFDEFFRLFKIFNIFPGLIAKVNLECIYHAVCFSANEEFMGEDAFVLAFLLVANRISSEPNIKNKLDFLLSLIGQSEGYLKMTHRNPKLAKHSLKLRVRRK